MMKQAITREFLQPDLGCTVLISEFVSPPEQAGEVLEVAWRWDGEPGDEEAAQARAESLLDAEGELPRAYRAGAPDHLRIYGVPGMPIDLVGRYLAHRAPTEFDWGLLRLQRSESPGEIVWRDNGVEIVRTVTVQDLDSGGTLTVATTPLWARNDGSWLEGESRVQTYSDQATIDALTYARRAKAHDRLRNEFGAYNLGRVRTGEISPQDMSSWLRSEECEDVLAYLRLLMFEAAITRIGTMSGVGATADFKTVWTAKLETEL